MRLVVAVVAALSIDVGLAAEQPPTPLVESVKGRCVGCDRPYQLSHFQFVSGNEAWATGLFVVVSESHVSQYSTVLRTIDGGATWRQVKRDIETYGVDVEPSFSFIGPRQGWIGWTTTSTPFVHLIRTSDAGRTWRSLPADALFALGALRFFNSSLGYAVASQVDGPQFAVTRDGGATWALRDDPLVRALRFPDAVFFLTPQTGWMGGTAVEEDGRALRPHMIRTVDGGSTWQEASFPQQIGRNPIDLFFLDSNRGWLILWNSNPSTLMKTTDGGRTWSEDSRWIQAASPNDAPRAVRFVSQQFGVLVVGDAVLTTADGGTSWRRTVGRVGDVASCEVVAESVWCVSGMDLLKVGPPR
jgi:photosystem II stability/assembly factor-like uncharacterized protein